MRRTAFLAAFTALALAASGCASLGAVSSGSGAGLEPSAGFAAIDLDAPHLREFPVAAMTDLERDVRLETGKRKNEKLTPALFWTGIIVGTTTAVGAVAFGTLGYVTKNQLSEGYETGGLTEPERDDLVSRGEAYNTTAVVMTTVAVISYALAIVTYGVDWNRCGPLVRKKAKRHCDEVLAEGE